MASQPIYRFYAELEDYEPKIWRRFEVPGNTTMARLGYVVMGLFEMHCSHLFMLEWTSEFEKEFISRNNLKMTAEESRHVTRYVLPDVDADDYDEPPRDATKTRISQISDRAGTKFCLNYDFGDDWWVNITLEEVYTDTDLPGKELPRVLGGEGYGILEDCGGVGGLIDIAEAYKKKKGNAYKSACEWLGVTNLDLTYFDLSKMNERIKKLPRIYKQSYEDYLYPTQKSIDIIEQGLQGASTPHTVKK